MASTIPFSHYRKITMDLSEFDYELPQKLIAQYPVEERDASRLMVVDRRTETIIHTKFTSLPEFLKKDDLLILNDTRVIPARLTGNKIETGGAVEILLLEKKGVNKWKCMFKRGKRVSKGAEVVFDKGNLRCKVLEEVVEGRALVEFEYSGDFFEMLKKVGEIPLPPYIKRKEDDSFSDRDRYQTIFAKSPGSSAAPTAGLHFTQNTLKELKDSGIKLAHLTLHVGPGTFIPIRSEKIEDHKMESEYYRIPQKTLEAIEEAFNRNSRVLGVGSTSLRSVEYAYRNNEPQGSQYGHTDLFIYPGYEFKRINGFATNFHLPKTTLFVLVCAFGGSGLIKRAYKEAIEKQYRFFSYGDAMLIL